MTVGDKVDWSRYVDSPTLVLLSAVGSIGEIARSLMAAGRVGRHPGRDDLAPARRPSSRR